MLEQRRLVGKKDDYGSFSAEFYGNMVCFGKIELPVGQLSTEFLELDDNCLNSLREKTIALKDSAQNLYTVTTTRLFKKNLKDFLPCFKLFLDELDKLPLFAYLKINQKEVIDAFVAMYNSDRIEKNAEFLGNFLADLLAYHDEIHIFRLYADTLLDDYVNKSKLRNPKCYAKETQNFFADKELQEKLRGMLRPEAYDNIFMIEQPVNIAYIPCKKSGGEYVIAERTVYRSLGGLLKADLFKALIAGNTPRVCQNCNRYFLTIGGSQILYCNRKAPNDPKGRTCLKVGRYIKQQRLKEIPYEKAYSKAYDRLKKRKQYGTLDDAQWNTLVAKIQNIRDDARNGKISDGEAVEKLDGY